MQQSQEDFADLFSVFPDSTEEPQVPSESSEQTPLTERTDRIPLFFPSEVRAFVPDARLVAYHDSRSPATEQYRVMRTNLLAMNPENPPRVMVVTSASKGEGKTVSTANLGTVLAEIPATNVLVVDCDLRNPSLHKVFGMPDAVGISEVLRDQALLAEAIRPTGVPGVDLLPAGSIVGAPLELFSTDALVDLLRTLRAAYSYVLIDTPPVFALTDAAVVGAQTDGALLVVRRHGPPREIVEQSVSSLRSARTHVLGCLMTGVCADRKYGRYPYEGE